MGSGIGQDTASSNVREIVMLSTVEACPTIVPGTDSGCYLQVSDHAASTVLEGSVPVLTTIKCDFIF